MSRHIIIKQILVVAVEGDERYPLLHVLMRLLHFLNRGPGLVDPHPRLALDNTPAATPIHYQPIEYSFHTLFLLLILIVQHNLICKKRNLPCFYLSL